MTHPVVSCRACHFWISSNGHNGHCKHSAPRPSVGPDQIAHWPETFADDICGQGRAREAVVDMQICERCAFWRRSPQSDGMYPVDRLGARAKWWSEAGYCKRYAPGPSSDSGQRGFWRVTHISDSCAEGRSALAEPPNAI